MIQDLFVHGNARRRTSRRTRDTIATKEWTVLHYPLYSSDLSPSDFHPFGPLMDALPERCFAEHDELKHSVR
jgi:hypothetical protein